MGIIILICFSLGVFCNTVLYRMVDMYREVNNGLEVNSSERGEANLYRILLIITGAITIFCSDYWWAPIAGYILGLIVAQTIKNEDAIAYITFFGKIIKPLAIIGALICTFV